MQAHLSIRKRPQNWPDLFIIRAVKVEAFCENFQDSFCPCFANKINVLSSLNNSKTKVLLSWEVLFLFQFRVPKHFLLASQKGQ